jgi:CRP-like cAMP-binding protein
MGHGRPDYVQNCDEGIAFSFLFKNLSSSILEHLGNVSSRELYCSKAKLFTEGQQARGVFILCTCKAKLFTSSSGGKEIITRFVAPGDTLGLSAVVSGRAYGATAEMMLTGWAEFIPQDPLLRLMKEYEELPSRLQKN